MNDTWTDDNDSAQQAAEFDTDTDVNSLLSEYETAKSPPKTSDTAQPGADVIKMFEELRPIAKYAENSMRSEAAQQEQETVAQAIAAVKEDDSLNIVPDTIVEGFLQQQYVRNPEFKKAFDSRTDSPDGWTAALGSARENLAKEIGQITKGNVKDDVEAALNTVRGTSETEIDDAQKVNPKELFAMSDHDFAEYKRNL